MALPPNPDFVVNKESAKPGCPTSSARLSGKQQLSPESACSEHFCGISHDLGQFVKTLIINTVGMISWQDLYEKANCSLDCFSDCVTRALIDLTKDVS